MSALQIGYFGAEGSFSHFAARQRFGGEMESCPLIESAFGRLIEGGLQAVVVPIENASSGIIADTVDQLIQLHAGRPADLLVRECLSMPIKLVLLAAEGITRPASILSHPAALAHARSWLLQNYPEANLIVADSTSDAARLALRDRTVAALAGEQAAEYYGLKIIRNDVQESIANRTKFYVIGRALPESRPATHTSLLFEAAHRSGSLVSALIALSTPGLNLTMIQSRPIPGRFDEYRFFIEFNGTPESEKGRQALAELERRTRSLHILGSYPIVDLS